MIAFVVIFNTLLALINFYIAWRVWKMRRVLAGVAKVILTADRNTYNALHPAPRAIAVGQKGTKALRSRYQQLELQLEKLGQILAVISFALGLMQKRNQKAQFKKR
jgi:hypothetical protein